MARAASSPLDPDLIPRPGRRPVLGAVFVGGCAGGLARYAVVDAWPAGPAQFPWSTLVVNAVGAFVLGVVIVVAVELPAPRLFRPLLGTGVCGAFTTFSSVVVAADQLWAHGHAAVAAGYVAASAGAGLLAAAAGVVATRTAVLRIGGRA